MFLTLNSACPAGVSNSTSIVSKILVAIGDSSVNWKRSKNFGRIFPICGARFAFSGVRLQYTIFCKYNTYRCIDLVIFSEYASSFIMTVMIGMLMQILSAILSNWVYGTKSEGSETISRHPRTMSIVNLILLAIAAPVSVSLADDGYEDDGVTKKKGLFIFVVIGFSLVCLLEHPANMYVVVCVRV